MPDAHKNFAISAVATAPTPAASGTSLVVTTGQGTRFPTVPFNAVVCPAATDPDPSNAEVVRVTGISTDTLTITRAQESSSARTIVVGDRIYAAVTAKTLTDVEPSAPSAHLIRYVDYVSGLDTNDGLSPSAAKKTIQNAYDDLKTVAAASYTSVSGHYGVGVIHLAPGDHDVGTGLVIDQTREVEIQGHRGGWESTSAGNFQSRIVSSSGAATSMVLTGSTTGITYGNRFKNVAFYVDTAVNTSMTAVIRAQTNDFLQVEDCTFEASSQTNACIAIVQDPNAGTNDNAWARITNNRSRSMAFYKAETGANFNRSIIDRNVIFYTGTNPAIWLQGDFLAGSVSFNNIEGPVGAAAIQLDSGFADFNVFLGNSGEAGTDANPYYNFTGTCNGNVIVGGVCVSAGYTGTFAQFATNSFSNIVIGIYDYVGTSGYMRKIVDNSTYGNTITDGRWGPKLKYKESASPSFTSTDFNTATPPNGTLVGITRNTSTDERKLWYIANGAFASSVL